MKLTDLKEGNRVVLKGDHPWATHAGTVVGLIDRKEREL